MNTITNFIKLLVGLIAGLFGVSFFLKAKENKLDEKIEANKIEQAVLTSKTEDLVAKKEELKAELKQVEVKKEVPVISADDAAKYWENENAKNTDSH